MKTKANNSNILNSKLLAFTLIGAFVTTPSIVMAQDEDPANHPSRERILNHFDKNGDGSLNDREKYHARKFLARWKNSHDDSVDRPERRRPDVRPDRVRPDRARPDVRPDRVRRDVRPDRVRPDVRADRVRPDMRRDRVRPLQRDRQAIRRVR